MKNLFERASSHWVKYSEYVIKDGYITPAPNAKPCVYDPLKDAKSLVVDALNVGLLVLGKKNAENALLDFVHKYGLLGFMTALPTTPNFMEYDAVYLPKNHFIKVESMAVDEYAAQFFPFDKPDFKKNQDEVRWDVDGESEMLALALTFQDQPLAINMSFGREYAERLDWLLLQFKDWAFTFMSSIFYYNDYDRLDETERDLYRKGMAAFGGIAPTYHIALLDKPTIVWDFHSLLLGVQMMFSFMLTDEKNPLRMCRHCQHVFAATHSNAAFCSPQCKNQYNVYKTRAKKD